MRTRGLGTGNWGLRAYLLYGSACVFALGAPAATAGPFSFEDIRYWVGTGTNRAALAIDWDESADQTPALVWGYRWSGAASGARMLADIVAADDRLFAKFGGTPSNPIIVYGLGYDADGDESFSLDDGALFNSHGIAYTQPADLAAPTDADDFYAEGWYTGFWHYGVSGANPYSGGAWSDTSRGMAGRTLTDGAWDSWTFSPTFNFASFAANPHPAASPFSPGDYDHSGTVDAADYVRWKNAFGSTSDQDADGNQNGIVDAGDYTFWRNHFQSQLGSVAQADGGSVGVPEPNLAATALIALAFLFALRSLRVS
jgi:hypothetical protein